VIFTMNSVVKGAGLCVNSKFLISPFVRTKVLMIYPCNNGYRVVDIYLLSPRLEHYANLYLGQLDHALRQEFKVAGYLRYMDDMTLFARDKRTLQDAHHFVDTFLKERLCLNLKDAATRLGPTRLGVPLLGFRVFPSHIRFDRSRLKRYRFKRRQLDQLWRKGVNEEDLRPRSEALSSWAQVANTYHMRRRHAYRLADEL